MIKDRLDILIENCINIIQDNNILNYNIDIIDIFTHSNKEYDEILSTLKEESVIVKTTKFGNIYKLNNPIKTKLGYIANIKVRIYDGKKEGYIGAIDLIVDNFDTYKSNINFNNKIVYISNENNDFIEYDYKPYFLYIIRKSNVK